MGAGWVARVQARNEHGWGALSPPADLDAAALAPHRPPAAALALALLALLALLLAVAAAVFYGMLIEQGYNYSRFRMLCSFSIGWRQVC